MLKGVLRGEFTSLSNYIKKKKTERAQINNLRMQLKNFLEQEETESKPRRQQEIIKVKA